MFQYIVRRILQFIPVFLGVTLLLFLTANFLPGADPIQLKMGEKAIDPATKARLLKDLGLDRPWYAQYGDYLSSLSPIHIEYYDGSTATDDSKQPKDTFPQTGKVALVIPRVSGPFPEDGAINVTNSWGKVVTRGASGRWRLGNLAIEFDPPDLGTSIYNGRRVTDILGETYPYTVRLAICAIIVEIIVGIGAGVISATKKGSFLDVLVTLSTSILVALPVFWLGIMLQYAFGIWLKDLTGARFYLPPTGASGEFASWVYLILPAITLAAVSTAYAARIMRSQLLEVIGQDYIRTAYAKGLSRRKVLWGHAMKNAMIPVVTFIGLDFGAMLSGAILTETVYNWPGVGYTIYRAIVGRDFPIVYGGVTVILFAVMFVNLLVDVSYAFLDPRIRFGGGEQ
ncbi:MAG: ABC transporter permease [Coriobacteriales bacterium]|nr:ABC transporter permease [Actinomycetes bacterium]